MGGASWAGGNLVRGPSLVLYAVRDARRAAAGIDKYLAGRTPKQRLEAPPAPEAG